LISKLRIATKGHKEAQEFSVEQNKDHQIREERSPLKDTEHHRNPKHHKNLVRRQTAFVAQYIVETSVANRDPAHEQKIRTKDSYKHMKPTSHATSGVHNAPLPVPSLVASPALPPRIFTLFNTL